MSRYMNAEKILVSMMGLGYTYSISKFMHEENTIEMNRKIKLIKQYPDHEWVRQELKKQETWHQKPFLYKIFVGPPK